MVREKPPVSFWIMGALLLVWGVVGVAGFVVDRFTTPAMLAQMSDYDRRLRAAQPLWNVAAYGVGTVTGLLGTIALLLRRRAATPLYVTSLIAVLLLFGYVLGATDIIAVKGFAGAAGLPIAIAAIAVGEIALARLASRRGWIV